MTSSYGRKRKPDPEWAKGLSPRARRTLLRAGCTKRADVVRLASEGRIAALPLVGPKIAEHIHQWLQQPE